MITLVEAVLNFSNNGWIYPEYISVAFEGREPCVSTDFVEELDLQLQINETELSWDE